LFCVYFDVIIFCVYFDVIITYLSNSIYSCHLPTGEMRNNIKIYTEQCWKMTIVYTVGEVSNNNIKIYTEQGWKMADVFCWLQQYIQLSSSNLVLCIFWCYFLSLQQYIQLPSSNFVLCIFWC
jgi:hypothetical protein